MDELKSVEDNFKVDEKILVIDSMIGQDAINVIKGFNETLHLTGCILTKMDSTSKGGVALCVRHLTNVPIKFIGDSEKWMVFHYLMHKEWQIEFLIWEIFYLLLKKLKD